MHRTYERAALPGLVITAILIGTGCAATPVEPQPAPTSISVSQLALLQPRLSFELLVDGAADVSEENRERIRRLIVSSIESVARERGFQIKAADPELEAALQAVESTPGIFRKPIRRKTALERELGAVTRPGADGAIVVTLSARLGKPFRWEPYFTVHASTHRIRLHISVVDLERNAVLWWAEVEGRKRPILETVDRDLGQLLLGFPSSGEI